MALIFLEVLIVFYRFKFRVSTVRMIFATTVQRTLLTYRWYLAVGRSTRRYCRRLDTTATTVRRQHGTY